MKRSILLLVATFVVMLPSPANTPVARAAEAKPVHLVSPAVMKLWNRVAVCETGGNWQMHGWKYSGGLGFRNDVWIQYGGGKYALHAGLANPEEQVTIAIAIQTRAGIPNYVPDQNGCAAW